MGVNSIQTQAASMVGLAGVRNRRLSGHSTSEPSVSSRILGRLARLDKTAEVDADVQVLLADPAVEKKSGIYEYVLSDKTLPQLLRVRLFPDSVKRAAYQAQTAAAEAKGVSNCSACAMGQGEKAAHIYKPKEMDADHVTAWSKGGDSTLANCEMLCIFHNRSKGNL